MDERPVTAWNKDGQYTEADIGRLEAGDLSDAGVCAKLIVACHQNEIAREEFRGYRRDLNEFVPDAELRK